MTPARSGLNEFDDRREPATDSGEINHIAVEATVDGVNEEEPVADERLPAADFVAPDEADVTEFRISTEDDASEMVALDAFPSESAGSSAPRRSPAGPAAPWRSPMAFQAPAADVFQPVDDRLQPGDDTDDPTVSWDLAAVNPPSRADIATDSGLSAAAAPAPRFRLRWLGMAALTLLLFAIGVSLLLAGGLGVYSAAPAMSSLEPASTGPVERTAGTAGVIPDPDERRAAREAPPSTERPEPANAPQSALPSSADTRLETAEARLEDALASTVARGYRFDTTDLAPSPAAPAPLRNSAPMPAPPPPAPPSPTPPRPAVGTVAREDAPSASAAPSGETMVRTLPPPSAGEGPAPAVPPASGMDIPRVAPINPAATNSSAATAVPPAATAIDSPIAPASPPDAPATAPDTPASPPAATVERAGTAGEAPANDGINAALQRLQRAYEQRDAALVKAVWPTVNERALARAFDGLRSQSITFDRCWMNVFNVSADVECRGVTTYVPRVGSQYQRTESRQWIFRVQKGEDRWLIITAEAR